MVQPKALPDFLNDLQKRVVGQLRTDDYSRMFYSTDASIYQVMPYGVLIPKTVDDVHVAVELAAQYRVPILPRTAGTSLAGQSVNEALIIDLNRLDQILEINPEERWVRVQPGMVFDLLNRQLKPTGLKFGPDPATGNRAAIGGIIGNNATGSHSILYGMSADHLIECNVILSDGSLARFGPLEANALAQRQQQNGLEGAIYRRVNEITRLHADTIRAGTPRHWRRCGGYNLDRFVEGVTYNYPQDQRFNLAKLICGSEGTLAVMTGVKLNLVPLPTKTALAIIHFDNLHQALDAVTTILQTDPSAIELIDNLGLTMCRQVPAYARLLATFIEGSPYCLLATEFYGESEAELKAKIDRLRQHLQKEKVNYTALVPAFDPVRQNSVWEVRKAGVGLLMSIKGDYKPIPFIEDAAVPVEHLADYIIRLEEFCRELGTNVNYHAHASAGCLHLRPIINTKLAPEINKLPIIAQFSVELLGKYGGAFSSEHGDGRARSWLNERFFGPELYALFKEVKQAFDPHRILNPGNIIDGPSMTENLRYGVDYQTVPVKEILDFSNDMGFHRAVEMCNGAGVCLKRTDGTMCPSFMVTREEEHSTRGRANALRAALSGLLPPEELTNERMYEVMDLCIECKACKAECPSSVDMAKIKFEFLGHYYQKHGIPLRSRIFADIALWSRLSSGPQAPFINWIMRNGLVKWGLEKFVGISRARQMPEFAQQPFHRWFKRRPTTNRQPSADKQQVVLFNDTFNNYNYPHVAIAATEVLEAAGFEVILPGHKCCGRPMISKGWVSKARRAARDTVDRLAPFAEQGIPIVGLEPSCLLSMRDEYLYLLPDDPRVKVVAQHCYTFEEFMAKLADEGQLKLTFTDEVRQILLHGHCQQKSLVGTDPSKRTLTLPSGYTVTEVDSGCCGLAGSFGYEAEHYDISVAMGERRLFPAVREQGQEVIIAAAGASCRQQVKHGTGRQVMHPAEILRKALNPKT
ncbi:MAG: FAD-binding protein [Anaerolineae bacterium]|nr:FAD-binding protein [Anaerolineae bacterium]